MRFVFIFRDEYMVYITAREKIEINRHRCAREFRRGGRRRRARYLHPLSLSRRATRRKVH